MLTMIPDPQPPRPGDDREICRESHCYSCCQMCLGMMPVHNSSLALYPVPCVSPKRLIIILADFADHDRHQMDFYVP